MELVSLQLVRKLSLNPVSRTLDLQVVFVVGLCNMVVWKSFLLRISMSMGSTRDTDSSPAISEAAKARLRMEEASPRMSRGVW